MSLTVPPQQLVNAFPEFYRWLVPRLNHIATSFPNSQPTSWYRSPGKNFEVGGSVRSQHLLGWAADFAGPRDEAAAMVALGKGLGLVGVDEGDHVHFQMYPAGVVPPWFFPIQFSV